MAMNRDDIIRMAREADVWVVCQEPYQSQLERFAKLIAAAEREACAKFIEDEYVRQFEEPWRQNLAKTIRASGQA